MIKQVAFFLAVCSLSACAVGPDYVRPAIAPPPRYKEASADWLPAHPADRQPRGAWWTLFGDEDLDRLEKRAANANLDVRIAEEHHRQALAVVDQTRASYFPTASLGAGLNRMANGTIGLALPPVTYQMAFVAASWVPDLWGSIRRSVEESRANAQASAATLGAAILSLQSTLATDYFALRVADAQQRLLEAIVRDEEGMLVLTGSRVRDGVAALTDLTQAQAQLEATRAQAIDLGIQRGQMEHAIAVLLGEAPAAFSIPPRDTPLATPAVPAELPAALLQRRPDVANAERLAAAANAQIGVAEAAFFPSLTISANGGFRAPSGHNLLSMPFRTWSVGPSLSQILFDAGADDAIKAEMVANYDAAAATYRKTVLAALQNVEDALLAVRVLRQEAAAGDAAAAAADQTLRMTEHQYRDGVVNYVNVIVAQTTASADRVAALGVRGRQIAATIQLITALGGDWDGKPDEKSVAAAK